MNALLLSEISNEQVELLKALSLLEQAIFDTESQLMQNFDALLNRVAAKIANIEEPLTRVEALLDALYVDELWADNKRLLWPLLSYQPSKAFRYTTFAPALKLILLQELAQRLGFDADIVYVPETLMVRITCNEDYAVIFDPVTGEAINWQELDMRMENMLGNPLEQYLTGEKNQILLQHYLTVLKNTLISEQQYQLALKCVDVLLKLRPDDPLERRDRGFLLHQLDCYKVAYDDYKYFVEHCPNDPSAQLLKLQLENIQISDNVLH